MMKEQSTRVLVVDDEDHIRRVLRIDLEGQGYEVVEAKNGKQAFALLMEGPIDAVVSDIRMPGGSGIDLAKLMKARDPVKPPLIFITAFVDIACEELYDYGVEAIINKPFDVEDILAPLQRALQSPAERWCAGVQRSLLDGVGSDEVMSLKVGLSAVELGQGGAFIELQSEFPHCGVPLNLALCEDNGARPLLRMLALVRWVRPIAAAGLRAGIGVEFFEMDVATWRQFEERLRQERPLSYIPMGKRQPGV